MEEERKENQSEEHSGENSQETNQNGSALPVSIKLKNSINLQILGVFSGKVMLGYPHRQQWLKVCPRSPSPHCYRKLSLPCCTRRPPRASTLTPRSPAEVRSNTVHPIWNSYRQSWETWGTSLIRWRVSTSMALLKLSPIPGNHWLCYGFNQGSFVYRSDLIFVSCCSKEIKLLMNELDEEKRIRLTLQVRRERTEESMRCAC